MLTLQEARLFLEQERGIVVTRQALHQYLQRHKAACHEYRGEKRTALWMIPKRLLLAYQPSLRHQQAGKQRNTSETDSKK